MSKKLNSTIKGYIVLWSMPDVSLSYTDIEVHAQNFGFNTLYVPKQRAKRHAWEKATNLGTKGRPIQPPPHKATAIKQLYGVEPNVRLFTVIVKKSSPRLVRHVVRRSTIPYVDDGETKRALAQAQLNDETVCIMEFNTDSNVASATGLSELRDSKGLVNGNLKGIVDDLLDQVSTAVDNTDGDEIRRSMREWLHGAMRATLLSRGSYFVPYSVDAFDELKKAKAYIEALDQYLVKPEGGRPKMMIVPLTDDGQAFEASLDVSVHAVAQFRQELQECVDDLAPIINGNRTKTTSNNIRQRVTSRYMELAEKINQYRDVLGDELKALNVYQESAMNFIAQARSFREYKTNKQEDATESNETA